MSVVRLIAFAAVCLLAFVTPASAQYMYLDSNANGVHDVGDILSPSPTPTTVDVYLDTNSNKDGTDAVCSTGDGELTINSYIVNLAVSGGEVTFSNFVNNRAEMATVLQPFLTSTTEMSVGRGGGTINPPGTYNLMTVTITATTGAPSINIVAPSTLQPTDVTNFGSACSGNDFDNTLKLGSDWFGVDGLGPAPGGNMNPVISAAPTVSGAENSPINVSASATDPDNDNVTLTQTSNAPFLSGPASSGPSPSPSIALTGVPDFTQSGSYTVTWTATDTQGGSSTASTAITIDNTNRDPIITAPATVSGTAGSLVTVTASAADPDGDNVSLSQSTDAAFLSGPTNAGPELNPSITLTGTPNVNQTGSFTVTWTATEGFGGSAIATTAIAIAAGGNNNPVIIAPATVTVALGDPVSITGSATDPDGQDVTLSQVNDVPFLTGVGSAGPALNPSITLTGTANQAGSFNITWSANDAIGGSTTIVTALTVTGGANNNPIIIAPATVSGTEGSPVTITGSASDPDGQNVTLTQTNNAAFLTGPASAGPSLAPSITLTGTPGAGTSGTYTINWAADDGAGGTASATTTLTISGGGANNPPVITAPATVSGTENSLVTITASASDPDGNTVTLSQTTTAPFLTGPASVGPVLNPSLTVTGTPSFDQAGTYTISWMADDGAGGTASASTTLTIENLNRAPVITAPATATGTEGSPVSITGSALDPDGQDVTLSQTNNAAFLTGPASAGPTLNPSITLTGTPGAGSAGTYTINWSADDGAGGTAAATTTLTITVVGGNQNPTVTAPATQTVDEGTLLTFNVTATDPDNDTVALSAQDLPTGASFTDNGNSTGTFAWTPGPSQSGTYTVTFIGNDGNGGTASATTVITVNNVNACPTADANGPYSGVVNIPITFNGTGSSDPDGDALTYTWVFGDGSGGTGVNPTHTYTSGGTFTVTLTVSDGVCTSPPATSTATVSTEFTTLAFTTGGNNRTSLNAGKPFTCVSIEPVNNSFSISDVDLTSIKMVSVGTGSVSEITASGDKTVADGDKNHNGVDEIQACFSKDDLRLLFSELPSGPNTVTVTITGNLITGGSFSASLETIVKGGGHGATARPNPLNPETMISFQTKGSGQVSVKVFDLNGRLVRTLVNESRAAGYQDVAWNGTNQVGTKVSSGIYYIRIESVDGRQVLPVTVLK